MISPLAWTGASLSVGIYAFAMGVVTFDSAYVVKETYEDEMGEDVTQEEGIAARG